MTKTQTRIIEIGLVVASIALSWVAIEAYFRFKPKSRPVIHEGAYKDGDYFDLETPLGYRPSSGVIDSAKCRGDCETHTIYDVVYTVNEHHFRHTPGPQDFLDTNDHKTILFVGGSFTFGEGVNDNETYPYFVKTLRPNWDVYNFGFHGYGAHQAVRQFQLGIFDEAFGGQADYVVFLTAPFHADRSYCLPSYQWGSPRYVLAGDKLVIDGECQNPRNLLQRILHKSRFLRSRIDLYPASIDHDEKFVIYLELIKELNRLANEKYGAKLLIAFMNGDDSQFQGSTYNNVQILDFLKKEGIFVFDSTLGPTGSKVPDEYKIPSDGHPNALGHKLRANLLIDVIDKLEKTY